MKLKRVEIILCEDCFNGVGKECHTPGCALWLHDSPGFPITPELYTVLSEWEEEKDAPAQKYKKGERPR